MKRHLMAMAVVCAATAMTCAQSPQPSPDDLVAPIVEEAMRSGPIAGLIVGISRDGRQIFAKGYGLADLENAVPATPETSYKINSITKSFTAVAILQLREAHELALEDTVDRLLPDLPTAWRPLTIRQLLTHTSGLPNYGSRLFRDNIAQDLTASEWVRSMADQPLLFEPGSGWSYSNIGYDILGLVIEKVSGTSYADYMRTHVTAPLHLDQMQLFDRAAILRHRARSYVLDRNSRFQNARSWGTYGRAAGGLGSTVADVLAWEGALKRAAAVSADSKPLIETPSTVSGGFQIDYGFGTRLGTMGSHYLVAHAGDGEGWTAGAVRVDDASLVVVVLTNTEAMARHGLIIATEITRKILGLPDADVRDERVSDEDLARFAGKYENGLEVIPQDGRLFAQLFPGAERDRMLYQGGGRFVLEPSRGITVTLISDHRGEEWVVVRAGGVFLLADRRRH
jgi:D-alanyl-D-alanine carboxypeptidase